MEQAHTEHSASKERLSNIETERKFLVASLPENLLEYSHEIIHQGYMVIGEDGSEARLRNRAGHYSLTIKSAGTLSRGEWQTELRKDQFAFLWPATSGRRLEKTRYEIPFNRSLIELDVYGGHLNGLVIAEIEFESEHDAACFQPPDWFGEEVTGGKKFKNQQLARGDVVTAT